MRNAGRISAAIEVLTDFEKRRVPLKTCLQDWGRAHRFAGSGDRAWISGLCLDALRQRGSLLSQMKSDNSRALTLATLRFAWEWPLEEITQSCAELPHGPGELSHNEIEALRILTPNEVQSASIPNFPAWLIPLFTRVFGEQMTVEMAATEQRAPVDFRVNTLKATPEKALKAMGKLPVHPSELIVTGLRLNPPKASERSPSLAGLTAFEKGWIEVQDMGSQLAALAAGDIKGKQVLDLCAGGGGKTLALSAMMDNSGQIFAWDKDARRLSDLFKRSQRAGIRNLQIRSPADGACLDDLINKIDMVMVDAPCSGTGTWRRHPDTKWRLTQEQLNKRIEEQDEVLNEAAKFVKLGGRLVYITCSLLADENEDRLAAFLKSHTDFEQIDCWEQMQQSNQLTVQGTDILPQCRTVDGAMRLTPFRSGTDGFYIGVLQKAA